MTSIRSTTLLEAHGKIFGHYSFELTQVAHEASTAANYQPGRLSQILPRYKAARDEFDSARAELVNAHIEAGSAAYLDSSLVVAERPFPAIDALLDREQ